VGRVAVGGAVRLDLGVVLDGPVREGDRVRHVSLAPLSSGGAAHVLHVAGAMIEEGTLRGVPRDLARSVVTDT
jgi:pyrroline-5-carboxylate reductase